MKCKNKHIDEEVLYKVFLSSVNSLVEYKERLLEQWKAEDGNELRRHVAKKFIGIVENRKEITEFNIDLFFKMIEKITVFENEKIIVKFLDGTEIKCIIK